MTWISDGKSLSNLQHDPLNGPLDTWVSHSSSVATFSGVRWGSVPFKFLMVIDVQTMPKSSKVSMDTASQFQEDSHVLSGNPVQQRVAKKKRTRFGKYTIAYNCKVFSVCVFFVREINLTSWKTSSVSFHFKRMGTSCFRERSFYGTRFDVRWVGVKMQKSEDPWSKWDD